MSRFQEVVISGDFSHEEIVTIVSVFEEWFLAIPESRIEVSIGDPAYATIHRMTTPLEDSDNGGKVLGRANMRDMWLWPDYYSADRRDEFGTLFEKVVRHEAGHYLGSNNHSDYGNALISTVFAHCINLVDIELVCEGRQGCFQETFPSCEE